MFGLPDKTNFGDKMVFLSVGYINKSYTLVKGIV